MDTFRSIVKLACIYGITSYIIIFISPSEKWKKYIKGVVGLVMFTVVAASISEKGINDIGISDFMSKYNYENFIKFDTTQMVEDETAKNIETYLIMLLESNGFNVESIRIYTNIDKDNCISITKAVVQVSASEDDSVKKEIAEIINEELMTAEVEFVYS